MDRKFERQPKDNEKQNWTHLVGTVLNYKRERSLEEEWSWGLYISLKKLGERKAI